MNLNPIRQNMTELTIGTKQVLFSYKTPVALFDWTNGAGNGRYFKTAKNWSRTTSRHVDQWIGSHEAEVLPQEFFDGLLSEVA